MMGKYCIVAVGYNRLGCLKRLLQSLLEAEYWGDSVDLKICLDNCGSDELAEYAGKFIWPFGELTVRHQPKRLGLRKHILLCGEYVNDYDAIAVFEDDLVASPAFYTYMRQAVPFYENDPRIAGISLYGYAWNVFAKAPFTPQPNGKDTYFMQLAQSWGQIWMKESWKCFTKWLSSNQRKELSADKGVPEAVRRWSDKSWLKYHIQYCIDNDKYFVYPYISLSTCYEEAGEHSSMREATLQVPLMTDRAHEYRFAKLETDPEEPVYDAYFERKFVRWNGECTELDLYGMKDPKDYGSRYFASANACEYQIAAELALELRPAEENIIKNIPGKGIYIYDLTIPQKDRPRKNEIARFIYFQRLYGNSKMLPKVFVEKLRKEYSLRKKKKMTGIMAP